MGADNLASFHRWRGWRNIARMMPIAIIDRPGWTLKAAHAPSAAAFFSRRIPESEAQALPGLKPPVWVFLHGPRSHLSSTEIRRLRRTSPSEGR
jgi:nicotinate-nucleotide adenylyltransferase